MHGILLRCEAEQDKKCAYGMVGTLCNNVETP